MEFTGSKSVITPEGVFIIGTYDENGIPNAMNAAWGMQSDARKTAPEKLKTVIRHPIKLR